MAVTKENSAPYAPASAILEVIDRYRNRGLAKPFTGEVLGRAGVSDSLIPRTLQALQVLDLIDDAGNPTNVMESLRMAPEPDFKAQLTAWLTAAYADVLQFINANDDEVAIRDAFRAYTPFGQQPRMVALFLGLCRAAGMRSDDQPPNKSRPAARKPLGQQATPQRKNAPTVTGTGKLNAGNSALSGTGLPAPIAGLLASLPRENGTWTTESRKKFLATFSVVLDFCYSIDDDPVAATGVDE